MPARVRVHAKGAAAVAVAAGQPLPLPSRHGLAEKCSPRPLEPPRPQEGKPIKQCAKEVKECEGLRNAYSACKRGQIDARSRLRGNKGY